MLQAKSEDGQLVTLANLPKKKIEYVRGHQKFFCPICHERVIVKAGTEVIPHFAHQTDGECANSSQGESSYHMTGKLRLKKWLQSQHIHVELESYLKEINQRPDLLLKINETKIAIEFQCTRIPIKDIQTRTLHYKEIGIVPIWILGKNLFEKTANKLHVSPFILQFVHQFNKKTPTTLFYFCPNTATFYIVSNLYLSSSYRSYHLLKVHHKNTLTFKQLVNQQKISMNHLFSLWKREFHRFRSQRRYRAKGEELNWRTWLYNKQIAIDQLPLYVYLPTNLQFLMTVPPWNWQSRICLDLIDKLAIGETFTIEQCEKVVQRFMYPQHYYPLINTEASPIQQYLNHLQCLKVIQYKEANQYYKRKEIIFNRNIEEAISNDHVFLTKLMYNYS